jgi:protein-S-isoprenylcysteine O-methyltransferase Ste14
LIVLSLVSIGLFLGLAAWGWGSWSGLLGHPARAGACLVILLATVGFLFSGVGMRAIGQAVLLSRFIIATAFVISLLAIGSPPYAESRDLATIDGDAVRYSGLVLLALGAVLRVGSMIELGSRFTWPTPVHHEDHRPVTTGFYRFIRHPSYLGVLLGMSGWSLVFRCWIALVLVLLFLPLFIPTIAKEEALLAAEFGEPYEAHRRRTWRMVPFLF